MVSMNCRCRSGIGDSAPGCLASCAPACAWETCGVASVSAVLDACSNVGVCSIGGTVTVGGTTAGGAIGASATRGSGDAASGCSIGGMATVGATTANGELDGCVTRSSVTQGGAAGAFATGYSV